jgi:hypothetical protein
MKNKGLAALAMLMCAATPAMADWDPIGSVDIGYRRDRERASFDLGGPVDRIRLRAEQGDVNCRSVDATFGNGRSRSIFNGSLRGGETRTIDLPGNERQLRRLSFTCGAQDRRGGIISIAADIGNHRADWQRGPDWQRRWSGILNWTSEIANDWQMIGSKRFEGRNDTETSFAGRRGMRIDSIALKPLDADARCSRVTANFQNGRSQDLALRNGDLLRRGQIEKLDLPGDMRNLRSLDMRCRATDARGVTIQIFTSH